MRWRVVAVVWMLVAAKALHGCSCGGRRDVRSVLPHAEAVVTGVVVGRHSVVVRGTDLERMGDDDAPLLYPVQRVDIAVTKVFKGDVGDHLALTEVGCCVCEYPFEVGKEYLIFVHPHSFVPERSMASFCWPTKLVSRASADLAALGNPLRTYPRRTEVRGWLRRSLDAGHAATASVLRRRPSILATMADERHTIGWAAAIGGLIAALLITVARGRRAGPRA